MSWKLCLSQGLALQGKCLISGSQHRGRVWHIVGTSEIFVDLVNYAVFARRDVKYSTKVRFMVAVWAYAFLIGKQMVGEMDTIVFEWLILLAGLICSNH